MLKLINTLEKADVTADRVWPMHKAKNGIIVYYSYN